MPAELGLPLCAIIIIVPFVILVMVFFRVYDEYRHDNSDQDGGPWLYD